MLHAPGPESNRCARMPTAFGLVVLAHCLDYCRIGVSSITPLTSALHARLRFFEDIRCAAVAGYAAHSARGLKSEESDMSIEISD